MTHEQRGKDFEDRFTVGQVYTLTKEHLNSGGGIFLKIFPSLSENMMFKCMEITNYGPGFIASYKEEEDWIRNGSGQNGLIWMKHAINSLIPYTPKKVDMVDPFLTRNKTMTELVNEKLKDNKKWM